MITLYLRYTIDPSKSSAFEKYVAEEQQVITECGGRVVGYYVPTDFAGPTNEGFGLIDFPSLAEYETYRSRLAKHALHNENVRTLEESGALLYINRAFIQRIEPRSKNGSR